MYLRKLNAALHIKWLNRLLHEESRPGFIAGVPYILIFRWLIVPAVLMRATLEPSRVTPWWTLVCVFAMLGDAALATWATYQLPPRSSARAHAYIVALDILLISIIYFTTARTQSLFFLFYLLPMFVAAEYFTMWTVLIVFACITISFAGVLYATYPYDRDHPAINVLWVKVYLARECFYLAVSLSAGFVVRLNRLQHSRLQVQTKRMRALNDFQLRAERLLSKDKVMSLAADVLVEQINARMAGVVDGDDGTFTTKPERSDAQAEGLLLALQRIRQIPADRENELHAERIGRSDWPSLLVCTKFRAVGPVPHLVFALFSPDQVETADGPAFVLALSAHLQVALERISFLTHIGAGAKDSAAAIEVDLQIDRALTDLVQGLNFKFAIVSLIVGEYIKAVKGRNVPEAWMRLSAHALTSDDIDAYVVRNNETVVIAGSDPRFNSTIYGRFHHENLQRIFSPIRGPSGVIGLVEAGCSKNVADQVFVPTIQAEVAVICSSLATQLDRALPLTDPLQSIAAHAIAILRAGSASVHIFEGARHVRCAGAGRASAAFLAAHPPRQGGLGATAILRRRPISVDDPEELRAAHSPLYEVGIRAIVAFPLALGAGRSGVLYVHYWAVHRITDLELHVGSVFAKQIEAAIYNDLMIRNLAAENQKAWWLSELQNVLQALVTSADLDRLLEAIADVVLDAADADNVVLYQFVASSRQFASPPTLSGDFLDRDSMRNPISRSTVLWRLLDSSDPVFLEYPPLDPGTVAPVAGWSHPVPFAQREQVRSCAVIALRLKPPSDTVGLLFVNYRQPREFTSQDRRVLLALAASAAIAISTARLHKAMTSALERKQAELDGLDALDAAIVRAVRGASMESFLDMFLDVALRTTRTTLGTIVWIDHSRNLLCSRSSRGFPVGLTVSLENGIIGLAARELRALVVSNVNDPFWRDIYNPLVAGTNSELAVPIVDSGCLLGVINLESDELAHFSDRDVHWIELLVRQLLVFIRSTNLSTQISMEAQFRTALAYIAHRVHGPDYSLEKGLRLLLTGVTAREGLGYSRAMLFFVSEKTREVHGILAIGPQNATEATAVWDRLGASRSTDDSYEARFASLVAEVESFAENISRDETLDAPLSRAVKSIVCSLDSLGAVSRAVQTGEIVTVQHEDPDDARELLAAVSEGDPGSTLICAPLRTNTVIGCLIIDNRFLPTERVIDADKLRGLGAFCEFIAAYVDNYRLRQRTQTRTYEELSHQIKRPLTNATCKVLALFEEPWCDDRLKERLLYVRSDLAKAQTVSKTVKLFADLTINGALKVGARRISRDSFMEVLIRAAVDFKVGCDPERPLTYYVDEGSFQAAGYLEMCYDPFLFEQALYNILDNAAKYSFGETVVRLYGGETSEWASIYVSNKGIALRPEYVDACTEREWRGSEARAIAGEGSGLGLWIVKHIMWAHSGRLEVRATGSDGLTVVGLHFPVC